VRPAPLRSKSHLSKFLELFPNRGFLEMQKRKAAIHQKQKSQDVSSRRSATKPAKTREEQAPNESPAPLAFHVDIPRGLKDILVRSRIQIKQKEKVCPLLSHVCALPVAQLISRSVTCSSQRLFASTCSRIGTREPHKCQGNTRAIHSILPGQGK
jgi:hypothetical protein